MDDLLRFRLDFRPVPLADRQVPGRVKNIPARLYIDKFIEHKEAYNFLQEIQELHGEGTKTVVRALLYYRDAVINKLAEIEGSDSEEEEKLILVSRLDFKPNSAGEDRIKHVSVRLYIDKFIEHREAYAFISEIQTNQGEGIKTLVRALLYYRDNVVPLLAQQQQLIFGGQV
jgi:hypothetical protein